MGLDIYFMFIMHIAIYCNAGYYWFLYIIQLLIIIYILKIFV